jgi:hypothetical protein
MRVSSEGAKGVRMGSIPGAVARAEQEHRAPVYSRSPEINLAAPFTFMLIVALACSPVSTFSQGKKGGAAAASPAAATAPQSASPAATSSAFIESQMLAYGSLDQIATTIATKVCSFIPQPAAAVAASPGVQAQAEVPTTTVVIYDQATFASLQSYESFIANAKAIVSVYETLLPDDNDPQHYDKTTLKKKLEAYQNQHHPTFKPRSAGISSSIDPFSDATSLLSAIAVASNSETPGSIVIPDSAMAVSVTRQLRGTPCNGKTPNVIYPPLFGNSSSTDYAVADIQSDLQIVQDVRDFVIKGVDEQNQTFMGKFASSSAGNPVLNAAFTDANGMYDSFMNALLQTNSSTGVLGSASVIQGYQLATVLAGPPEKNGEFAHPAFILLASILSAGGTERDHKSLWTALGSGDKITFSGGLMVNVSLWHSDSAAPIYSNLLRFRAPFSNVADPSNLTNLNRGDNLSDVP